MTRRRGITSAAQERLGGRRSIAGPMSHPGRRGATESNNPAARIEPHSAGSGSVATAGPGLRTAELRVTSSAQGGRAVWLSVRVAVIWTQCKPWRSISISPTRGHARRLCRRGRAVHNLILWDLAGSAVIPRMRREGADARLVVTSAGRLLSECGGCDQCGHSQSNNEGFARSHNDPFLSKVKLTLSCYCWDSHHPFSSSHLMSVCAFPMHAA